MSRKDTWSLIVLICGGLVYSVVSLAYIHTNFPTRYENEYVVKSIDNLRDELRLFRLSVDELKTEMRQKKN